MVKPALTRSDAELRQAFFQLRTAHDVARLLELPFGHLQHILYGSRKDYPYGHFEIAKRGGGSRLISVPPPSIGILQSKLLHVLTLVYRPKPPTHGFVLKRSIVSNARAHLNRRDILNIDLKDFFPSIHFGRVQGMFKAGPYRIPHAPATLLADICCDARRLPQGAATSPIISNMVCARLDGQLQGLAARLGCTYTRYSDDMTFSTRRRAFPEALAKYDVGSDRVTLGASLIDLIKANDFEINEDKVRLQKKGRHQEVTGLVVSGFVNVRRKYTSQLRAMLHAWDKYGLDEAEKHFRERYDKRSRQRPEPSFKEVVRGKLAFLAMVKGETDPVYVRMRNELHRIDPSVIDPAPFSVLQGEGANVWSGLLEKYRSVLLHLELRRNGEVVGSGTAFGFRDGLVVTAAHNVQGEVHLDGFPDGIVPIQQIHVHPEYERRGVDVAIIEAPEFSMPREISWDFREQLVQPTEELIALGFPTVPNRMPEIVIYQGHAQATLTNFQGLSTIMVGMLLPGGMSGGPTLDRHGNLVAIVMEETYEQTAIGPGKPPRPAAHHLLPISYLHELID